MFFTSLLKRFKMKNESPKRTQDGSKSALKAAENDDFARDILKK